MRFLSVVIAIILLTGCASEFNREDIRVGDKVSARLEKYRIEEFINPVDGKIEERYRIQHGFEYWDITSKNDTIVAVWMP